MDKLATSCVDFTKCGMLKGTCLENSLVAISTYPNMLHLLIILMSHWFILDNELADSDGGGGGSDSDSNSDDNDKAVTGPKVLAHVGLAKTICEYSFFFCSFFCNTLIHSMEANSLCFSR